MSRTYTDIGTGKFIDINIAGNDYLGKITIGLWEKLGFAPKTEEDCKLVSRIINNHIKYQEYSETIFEYYEISKLDHEEIIFFKEVANFFEKARGIK